MITGIIFAILSGMLSWAMGCMSSEDNTVDNVTTLEEVYAYFEKAREMAPAVKVDGGAFHYEKEYSHDGKWKTVKKYSYTGEETFQYNRWLDSSEFPDISTMNSPITVIKFSFEILPGDPYTAVEFATFKENYSNYVKQLDEHSGKFKTFIEVLGGHKSSNFHTNLSTLLQRDQFSWEKSHIA